MIITSKFISMQQYYNLIYREEEREMNVFCEMTKVGLIPWSPNARGILTRPVELSTGATTDGAISRLELDTLSEAHKIIINRVEDIANKRKVLMAVVATSWAILKGGCPIVGLGIGKRVDDYIVAIKFALTDDEVKYFEEPYQPKKYVAF